MDEQKNKEFQYKIGANMGYFYNWVIGKKVNIAPYLALGFGGKFSSYRDHAEGGTKEKCTVLHHENGRRASCRL